MPERTHRGSDLNLAWSTPPWVDDSGETIDATDRDAGGTERTEGEPDLAVLNDQGARGDAEGGDGVGPEPAPIDVGDVLTLAVEVAETTDAREARARLLRPTPSAEGA